MEKLQFIQFASVILMAAAKSTPADAVLEAYQLWQALAQRGCVPTSATSEIDH